MKKLPTLLQHLLWNGNVSGICKLKFTANSYNMDTLNLKNSRLAKYGKALNLTLIGLFFCTLSFGQNYKAINNHIDSLVKLGLPKSALAVADTLYRAARKDNNAPQEIKAAMYRMRLQPVVNEAAYVIIIDTLKAEINRANYPAKPILVSLLAETYHNYYNTYRYQFYQRSKLEKPGNDFTKWDLQTVSNEIARLFILSLADHIKEQQTPIDGFDDILTGDKDTRYLRPTLYDLLVQEALSYFLNEQFAVTQPLMPFTLNDPRLFSDGRSFANLQITTTDTSSTFYRGIKLLQQATLFHLQKPNDEALVAIDLQRLEFVYGHAVLPNKDSLYLDVVKRIAASYSTSPISADALVLLGKYYQGGGSMFYGRSPGTNNLKLAVDYFNKAVSAFPQSIGGKNAAAYLKVIKRPALSAIVEDMNIPGKPLLASLTYQNIKTAQVSIYKVSQSKAKELINRQSSLYYIRNSKGVYLTDSVYKELSRLQPVQDERFQLPPDSQDYLQHTTEFKINPLPPGSYALVVHNDLANDSALIRLTIVNVSRLSFKTRRVSATNVEVKVMDRETGAPQNHVNVTLGDYYRGITNATGSCIINVNEDTQYAVKLTTPTDTLFEAQKNSYWSQPESTDTNTMFFTDRKLYRPGQIVYYKGLQLKIEKGKSSILTGMHVHIDVRDDNKKNIYAADAITNEFGTFSGSFIIPQNILNGNIYISTPDEELQSVKVEEYKLPSFEAKFLPVTESYKPGDSVIIKGSANAYSGYGLSGARVVYHVNTNGREVVTDTIHTDGQGNFKVKFKALSNEGINQANARYYYNINAEITDASGETKAVSSNVIIGQTDITINVVMAHAIFAKNTMGAGIMNLNNIAQSGTIQLSVYPLVGPGKILKNRLWNQLDIHLLSKADYDKYFPDYTYENEDRVTNWAIKDKIIDTTLKANKQSVVFKLAGLKNEPTGYYKMVLKAKTEHGDTTSTVHYFYFINQPGIAQQSADWITPVNINITKDNSNASFIMGVGKPANVLVEMFSDANLVSSKWITLAGGKQQLVKVPVGINQPNVTLSFLMISENREYVSIQSIITKPIDTKLDVKFLTFRDNLQPGEKEQWKIQITGKDGEKEATEILASMYDASLDALGSNSWGRWMSYDGSLLNMNSIRGVRSSPVKWDYGFIGQLDSWALKTSSYAYYYFGGIYRNYERFGIKTVFNSKVLNTVTINGIETVEYKTDTVEYRAADYKVNDNSTVDELLKHMEGFQVGSDGSITSQGMAVTKARLNGKDYAGGDIAEAIKNLPADVVQKIQVVDDYGDQAARTGVKDGDPQKVLNITTLNNIVPRINFNETAFFYPQLHTDSAGQILIDFTVPESLTTWTFRMFAHTKDLKTAYVTKKIVTQKQLSVSANMPRFLREGDTITVSARVSNLTASALKGQVNLQLFNAVTMKPVSLLINPAEALQNFALADSTNRAIAFKLVIPAGLDALTYRIIAAAGDYSDGEENTLPVLPNRMLVTEAMPMMVRPGQTKTFTFDKLVNAKSTTLANKSLTLEYTQNPAWYAIQALPYMMEFPYECSEQTFSRYYANSLGTNLVNSMPVVKQVFDKWKAVNSQTLLSNLEKNQDLKSTLLEETPWLRDATSESEQKKRVALLFDINKMSYELQTNLAKLKDKQLSNGGFPWFSGDRSDAYITRYILAGIGQLYHLGVADIKDQTLKSIADKAMAYMDKEVIAEANSEKQIRQYDNRVLSSTEIHEWYTESYFTARKRSAEIQGLLDNYLALAQKQWTNQEVYEQGMIALTMLRNKKPDVAKMIIRSLLETARQSDDMGMYWAKNRVGYFWYQSPIETQSLMIELFTEAGNQQKAVDEMKIWLIRNKQANDWRTTKATAQACYALLMKGDSLLSTSATSVIKLDDKPLNELKPGIKTDAGIGYIKTNWVDEQIKPAFGKVEIDNNSKTISWGALYWQYTEQLDKITSSNTDIHLERKYFIEKQTSAGPVLTAVDAQHTPKTGDLLKVVVYLRSDRDFEYVQLKDMRPAGTEPVDVLSSYKYQDGLYYYQVTKDVATNFFISQLNKGSYVFEYRLRVVQPGNYSTGISSIQSMYAPEFNAHSEGMRMVIGK